jgi:hypothetical protein
LKCARVLALWLATTAGTRAASAWGPATTTPATPAPAGATPAHSAPAPANGTAAATSATDVEGPMQPEAAALYTRGLERYTAHDYGGAIADLEAGYAIEPRREFLFAEGQAKRLAGDCKGAVTLYQRFLATNPPAVQANATQIALGRCAQHLAAHPEIVVVQPPRPPPPPPPPPPKWWRDPWGIGFTGAGAVGIGVGIGFLVAANAARDDANHASTYDPFNQRWSTAESRWSVGVGTLALGTALTAAGVTRFVLVRRQAREATKQLVVSVGAGGLQVGGAF